MLRNTFPFLLCLFLLNIKVSAQEKELPSTSISLQNLNDFKPAGSNWKIVGDVFYDLKKAREGKTQPGAGVLVNDPSGKTDDNLFTKMEHGDIELDLDFMMNKGSNSGIYLQGRYEVQLRDSWGVQNPTSADCGAITERWDEAQLEGQKGYEGHASAQNVSKAPGLWQHLKIVFRAPRFNGKGEKVADARFVKVVQNGVTLHENIEVTGPTRAAAFQDEKPLGPLMLQGDHGPVAFRNISYKAYGTEPVTLTDMTLKSYEGKIEAVSDFDALAPATEMKIDVLEHLAPGDKNNFAGKIMGTLHLPRTGDYLFNLNLKWIPLDTNPANPNGGGALTIGDKQVFSFDGKTVASGAAMVHLEAGDYPVVLSYYKKYGHWYAPSNDITLSVEGPGVPFTLLNTPLRAADPVGAITVLAENEPVMQRSFMEHQGGKKTHVISVGEPGNANYTLDLRTGDFLQLWRGKFLETTPMWHERGESQLAIPLGSVIAFAEKPSLTFLEDKNTAWPDSNTTYNYLGYDVDKAGRPTFKYTLGAASIKEAFTPEDGGKKLVHSFTIMPGQETKAMWCRVAEGNSITALPNGLYAINDKQYLIELPRKAKPVIRNTAQNMQELLLPVNAQDKEAVVTYSIVW